LQAAVDDGLALRQEIGRTFEAEMNAANRDAITAQGFELEAQRVARLLRDQYRLGFIDVGGWDTHVNEGGATGVLATRLASLGRGLAVLARELGDDWRSTVVTVISEFGRTFAENGNRGTDHGRGSVYWALGGALRGGRIAGEQARVDRASLFENRDFQVLNDYRAVLAGVFRRLYGLSDARLESVFPDVRAVDLDLI
jgi:uncharacterized protein (DUF1501 family)